MIASKCTEREIDNRVFYVNRQCNMSETENIDLSSIFKRRVPLKSPFMMKKCYLVYYFNLLKHLRDKMLFI